MRCAACLAAERKALDRYKYHNLNGSGFVHTQAFLRTFWRLELRPQVFVAMSFAPQYTRRFEDVIKPAIANLTMDGVALAAHRVDLSKSGDSILTDIVDGIAHSQLVLADVSSIGRDSVSGRAYRNGNVMYEVGVALACRQPSEVLLLRDDEDAFLFDVSSIPHMKVDFADKAGAQSAITDALNSRLRERQLVHDARVKLALSGLSSDELEMLRQQAANASTNVFGRRNTGSVDFFAMASIPRLLDKGVIQVAGEFTDGTPAYRFTPLGLAVAGLVARGLPKFVADQAQSVVEPKS